MQKIIKNFIIIMPAIIGIILITACTNIKNSTSETESATTYFHKGVYKSNSIDKNSNKIYFYVFNDENSGHTEDSKMGIGLPFSCIQMNGMVKFKFGGSEEHVETLIIKSARNNIITGSFIDGLLLEFTPIPKANPNNFDAIKYLEKK